MMLSKRFGNVVWSRLLRFLCGRSRLDRTTRAVSVLVAVLAVGASVGPAGAAFPGKNGRIVYDVGIFATFSQDGTLRVVPGGVYTVRPDGTGRRLLFRNEPGPSFSSWVGQPPSYSGVAYAPRGTRIAFTRERTTVSPLGCPPPAAAPGGGESSTCVFRLGSIWSARSDGTRARQLVGAGPGDSLSSPAWAPDGRRIVFRRDACAAYRFVEQNCPANVARQSGLFVYRRGHTRQLTHRGTHPSWSPNGRRIAYVLNGVLYVIRPDGSGRRRIFNTGWRWSGPISWSPNNRRILIDYRTKSGLHRIATIRSDGRGFRRLARLGHVPAFPFSYSPDGRWIVFARDAPGLPFPGLAPGNNDPVLMTMRADGKRQRRIRLPSGRSIRGIPSDWQPLPR